MNNKVKKNTINIKSDSKDINNLLNNISNNFTFANDNRRFKYYDIISFIIKNENNEENKYPSFISKIQPKKRRKNIKKRFRKLCNNYRIDKKTNRLQRKIKLKDINGNIIYKNFFIAYINEKKIIMDNLHELSCHRGINTLYNLIKDQDFIWFGIFKDLKFYIKNCIICQQLHKNINKKSPVKQILSNAPKERYVVDLLEIDKNIDDNLQRYKYILNIIDHFTKFTGSYLLERKSAQEVLYSINEFILRNGKPQILQSDNGREFNNKLINEYCETNGIKIIHSRPRHPSTNGVVERVHQNIRKALLALKQKKKIIMI